MSEDLTRGGSLPWLRRERRTRTFTESLSLFMVVVAALGAFLVLLDPRWTGELWGVTLNIGGDGFSADLKGAVISAILIGGWTAVKEYWLGSSASGQRQQETVSKIAEQSAPAQALAVAAARADPVSPVATPAEPMPVKIVEGAGTASGEPLNVQEQPKEKKP